MLSVLLFLHLLAVVGEPLRMFSQGRRPSSPDAQVVRHGLGPYIDFAYLHHGYFFFAPNPGPSHLMDIRLVDADGSTRHLRLPDHRAQWPRLLYHRHFMLSEFLYQLYTPQPTPDLNAATSMRQAWQRDREMFERVRTSMERHLANRYGAVSAEIQLLEHRLPDYNEVFEQQLKLNAEQFYTPLPDEFAGFDAADSERANADPLPSRQPSPSSPARGPLVPNNQTPNSEVLRNQGAGHRPSAEPEEVRP